MPDPLFDPAYWRERLEYAQGRDELWKSIFNCHKEKWDRVETRHIAILKDLVGERDNILDAGCGYGRLLNMLPATWKGDYLGVDISPDLIRIAYRDHIVPITVGRREVNFVVGDLRHMPSLPDSLFDWGILISIKPMVIRHMGQEEWDKIETELRRVCKRLMYLEYDENGEAKFV